MHRVTWVVRVGGSVCWRLRSQLRRAKHIARRIDFKVNTVLAVSYACFWPGDVGLAVPARAIIGVKSKICCDADTPVIGARYSQSGILSTAKAYVQIFQY